VSRLPDHLNPPAIVEQQKQSRFVCSACGSARDCDCKAFALERVVKYDKANPGQSTRQAAADLGIPKSTVSDARAVVRDRTPVSPETPETIIGRDQKIYPATRRSAVKHETPETPGLTAQANKHLARIIPLLRLMTTPERLNFRRLALQQMADDNLNKDPDVIEF
jgi:hypothetical protein